MQATTDDLMCGTTDSFRRLMVTNEETEDVPTEPPTENREDTQATSMDQETPTKEQVNT